VRSRKGWKFQDNGNCVPATFIASWRRNTRFNAKIFSHLRGKRNLLKSNIFFTAIWRVVKSVFITLVRKRDRHWKASKNIAQEITRKNTMIPKNMGPPFWDDEGCKRRVFVTMETFNFPVKPVQWLDCHVVYFYPYLHLIVKWIFLRLSVQPLFVARSFLTGVCVDVLTHDWICVLLVF
jgi:hypothetical protein